MIDELHEAPNRGISVEFWTSEGKHGELNLVSLKDRVDANEFSRY